MSASVAVKASVTIAIVTPLSMVDRVDTMVLITSTEVNVTGSWAAFWEGLFCCNKKWKFVILIVEDRFLIYKFTEFVEIYLYCKLNNVYMQYLVKLRIVIFSGTSRLTCNLDVDINNNKSKAESRHFPDSFETSIIIPLFKNGDSGLLINYRPISILPTISKVFERVIYDQLYLYFNNNTLLADEQLGFRKKIIQLNALL